MNATQDFATVGDVIALFRPLTPAESQRANALLPIVSDVIRTEARKVGKDIDDMILADCSGAYGNTVKAVTVDVVSRMILSPTDEAPLSQFSQSAMGYTVSGTYLVPGGGVYIKKSELARLGLRRQQIGVIDLC